MRERALDRYLGALSRAIERELQRELGYGCVTMTSRGAHDDMDFRTFLASRDAIVQAFGRADWSAVADFDDLRRLGQEVEAAMMEGTGGINTHKGLIFLHSFLILAWVRGVTWAELASFIRDFAQPLAADYEKARFQKSALLNREGVRDIRQIPLSGFAFIIEEMGAFRAMSDDRLTLELLSRVDDTTTIARSSLATLRKLQKRAGEVLAMEGEAQREGAEALSRYYVDQRISSGGVADLFTTIRTLEALDFD